MPQPLKHGFVVIGETAQGKKVALTKPKHERSSVEPMVAMYEKMAEYKQQYVRFYVDEQ